MLVSPAYAQAAAGGASPTAAFAQFIPLILIFAIMYFLMIRPQQKKMKEHRAMVEALRRGDQVLTQGGIIGKVVKVHDDGVLDVEIDANVVVKTPRSTIVTCRAYFARWTAACPAELPAPATNTCFPCIACASVTPPP